MDARRMSQSTTTNGNSDVELDTTEAIKVRIEREIRAVKNRLAFKADGLQRLRNHLDSLNAQHEGNKASSILSSAARARLAEQLRDRAQQLESEVIFSEKITLSLTNARKYSHIPVYYSKTGFQLFVVSPNITCGTLVKQILNALVPHNNARDLSQPFDLAEFTVVYNTGRKPGIWAEEELASPKLRDQDAISFLSSLSFDSQKGFGVNGASLVPLQPNAPVMFPPLYLVRRLSGLHPHPLAPPIPVLKPATEASAVELMNNDAPGAQKDARLQLSEIQEDPQHVANSSFYSMPLFSPRPQTGDNREGSRSGTSREVSVARPNTASFLSIGNGHHEERRFSRSSVNEKNAVDDDAFDADEENEMEKTSLSCSKRCRSWSGKVKSKLKKYASSSKAGLQNESSAFEAFAALILLGDADNNDVVVDLNSSATSTASSNSEEPFPGMPRPSVTARQRILSNAADLMDFAWLGRGNPTARLYCRQLGTALGLDRPPRSLWAVIFKDIAMGSGDRLAHSVDFDEFRSQYKTLRRWDFPGDQGVTYGSKIDDLVIGVKTEMKSTYERVDLKVPIFVWSRRIRALLLLAAFVLIVVASIENSRAFVEVANAFPGGFKPRFNFVEYYNWTSVLCARLIRNDIGEVVVRQHRSSPAISPACVNMTIFEEFSSSSQQRDVSLIEGTEWTEFQESIPLTTSAHGRFADYNTNGFPLDRGSSVTGKDFGLVESGLDVSSRAVIVDFELVNTALDVAAHGKYITEFDSNGATVSRLQMTSETSDAQSTGTDGFETFVIYMITASVLLGAVFLLAMLPTLRWCIRRRRGVNQNNHNSKEKTADDDGDKSEALVEQSTVLSTFTSAKEFLFVGTFFILIAFATTVPLIFLKYNSNLLAVASLSTAFALSVSLYSLERSWSKVLGVFDTTRNRLLSIFVQYVVLVLCYSVALDGWYGDRPYVSFHYGQTALATSVLGIVQNYAYILFPTEQRTFGNFISILFGMFFVMVAMTLVYIFFSIIVVGFRVSDSQPNWGLFTLRSRRSYRPTAAEV